jgi:hypothetical protein
MNILPILFILLVVTTTIQVYRDHVTITQVTPAPVRHLYEHRGPGAVTQTWTIPIEQPRFMYDNNTVVNAIHLQSLLG